VALMLICEIGLANGLLLQMFYKLSAITEPKQKVNKKTGSVHSERERYLKKEKVRFFEKLGRKI